MQPEKYEFLEETFSKMKTLKSVEEVSPAFRSRLEVKMKDEMPPSLKAAWALAVFYESLHPQRLAGSGNPPQPVLVGRIHL